MVFLELEGEYRFPSETQQRDRTGQLLEIRGLWNVDLESGPQGIEPVFGSSAAGEGHRGSVAPPVRRQAPHLPNQPVAVFLGHGKAADQHIRSFSLDQAKGGDGGIDRGHAGAVLLESGRDDLAYVWDTIDYQHLHSSQAGSIGP